MARHPPLEIAQRSIDSPLAGEAVRSQGDRSLAIQTFRDLLNREPANEEAHVGLMRLYGQSGKRHLALRQYQELSKVLRRELDADPSLESKQLYQSLLLGRGKTDATDADRDDPTDSEVAVAIELSPGPPDETFVPPTRSPPDDSRPHNLPVSLTSFIGRRSELTTVTHLVRRHRLVTLTGIGGAGKSRLALESARALLEEYEHGAWLINLSSLSDTALLAGYIALALGINVQGARPPIDVLTAALKITESPLGARQLRARDRCLQRSIAQASSGVPRRTRDRDESPADPGHGGSRLDGASHAASRSASSASTSIRNRTV